MPQAPSLFAHFSFAEARLPVRTRRPTTLNVCVSTLYLTGKFLSVIRILFFQKHVCCVLDEKSFLKNYLASQKGMHCTFIC